MLATFAPPGFPLSDAFVRAVVAAYAVPTRHYHTFAHVLAVAGHYHRYRLEGPGFANPSEVFLAVLAHDAVYDLTATDNELRSALLCDTWAQAYLPVGVDPSVAAELVRATAAHGQSRDAGEGDLAAFLDCDLAILGANADAYDIYEVQIGAEYAHVPRDAYRAGRSAFLQRMLALPRIFHTAWFEERYGARARDNLVRALVELS